MLNDPLIPTPPATAADFPGTAAPVRARSAAASRTAQRPARAKHPAMSARILATGLAATGTLGLTAGYALGQKPDDAAPVLDNMLASATGAQVAPQPNVVVVPVQPPVAASPGNGAGSGNWDSGPTQQQSSGSN